jgi:hypothetical protein
VGDTVQWWWPNSDDGYWPDGVPQEETVPAFVAAYKTRGYFPCETGDLEEGFEKIALYGNAQGTPKHASHQLPDGKWESKLGGGVDIQHDSLLELTGKEYGEVVCYLSRPMGLVGNEVQKPVEPA